MTRAIATVGMALLILVGVGCAGGIGRELAIVCPPAATSKLVVIDAQTGAFIFPESPAP